ncbi:MAG: ImmA/IrrE family metallo-endopeptidase [Phycisphaerae bacterium]|nr:ImmA/IrrE family metallo-endopeptidase [Phycisphaerae bacterium]
MERCRRKLRLDQVPLPVPVEEWIEGPLGIRFGYADLSHLGDGVLGATYVESREILIDEQALTHDGRCRFTCAHELGHLVLHAKVQSEFRETHELGPGSSNLYERQADRFAAAFLMPLPLLEREILQVFDEHRMDKPQCTIELMKTTPESEWLWRKRLLPKITRRFDVSLSAAIIRCSDIQPRITEPRRLLSDELAERLLRPMESKAELDSIEIVEGVPKRQDLFSLAESSRCD